MEAPLVKAPRLLAPPRNVPLSLRLREVFNGVTLAGFLFAGFGGIFAWVFVPAADFSGWRYSGALERAQATATACDRTGFSVGGGKGRSGTPVYANRFDLGGVKGVSYATGTCLEPGRRMEVEFPRGEPKRARIVGMRARPLHWAAGFASIFAVAGLIVVGFGLRGARKRLHLFSRGVLGKAKTQGRRATNVKINNRTVFAVTLAFRDRFGKEHRFEERTVDPGLLEDDELENVLYDPERPEVAAAVDLVEGGVPHDPDGNLTGETLLSTAGRLVVPALVCGGHLITAVWFFSR